MSKIEIDINSITQPRCVSCLYYTARAEYAQCRLHGPLASGFPPTGPDKWCGDHPDYSDYEEALSARTPGCKSCRYLSPHTKKAKSVVGLGFCDMKGNVIWEHDRCYLYEEVAT